MKKFKTLRADIPVELYEKFKKYLKKEYRKPVEFFRKSIVDYVNEYENKEK